MVDTWPLFQLSLMMQVCWWRHKVDDIHWINLYNTGFLVSRAPLQHSLAVCSSPFCLALEIHHHGLIFSIFLLRCAEGFYGNPQELGGYCRRCECNLNSDPSRPGLECDPLFGGCLKCRPGTMGDSCELCQDWWWGDSIQRKNCEGILCVSVVYTFWQEYDSSRFGVAKICDRPWRTQCKVAHCKLLLQIKIQ